MKKPILLCILLLCLSIFIFPTLVSAADSTTETITKTPDGTSDTTTVTTTTTTTTTQKGLSAEDFADDGTQLDYGALTFGNMALVLNSIIDSMQNLVAQSGKVYGYLNTGAIAAMLYQFFFPIGLVIFFISFLVSLGRKAAEGELFDPSSGGKKGFIREFLLFFSGVVVISISGELFSLIDGVVAVMTQQFVGSDLTALQTFAGALQAGAYKKSNIPIIGFFINLVNSIYASLNTTIIAIILIICYAIISVVVGIRIIKLAIYKGFSPLMMGMMGGESTQRYTRNFIVQYCLISFQILIISALLSAFEVCLANIYASMAAGVLDIMLLSTAALMALVFTVMIVKSDKLFDKVFM